MTSSIFILLYFVKNTDTCLCWESMLPNALVTVLFGSIMTVCFKRLHFHINLDYKLAYFRMGMVTVFSTSSMTRRKVIYNVSRHEYIFLTFEVFMVNPATKLITLECDVDRFAVLQFTPYDVMDGLATQIITLWSRDGLYYHFTAYNLFGCIMRTPYTRIQR